jgi:rhomboid protease GluP
VNDNSILNPPPPPPQPAALRIPLYRARWTWVLLAAIIVIYILEEISGGSQSTAVLKNLGANYGPYVSRGEYWRLFTANFLHIGLTHILLNGYALYVLGQETEALYGSPRFLVIFLLACLSGALASFAFTYGLSAGASTGIVGLIGTQVAFFVRNRKVFGQLSRSRLTNLLFIGIINVVYALGNPRIDNWGHLGGLIGGLLLGWLLCPFYQVQPLDNGTHRIVDLNSLRVEWRGLVLFCALLVVAFIAALSMHRA